MSRAVIAAAVTAVLLAGGCVGSRSYVSVEHARYPVSMSSAVRGPGGELLGPDQLVSKGSIDLHYLTCRMLWTIVPLKPITGTRDISDEINAAVAARGGEAVINLSVTSGATVWNVFTLVGVLPDCSKVAIHGDVVARRSAAAPAAAMLQPAAGTR